MPARVVDPIGVFEMLARGLTPTQIADNYHVKVAAVYSVIKENPHLSGSATASMAWLRKPLCQGDWREFINVENEEDGNNQS